MQLALEAIEEINLKFEHLGSDRFVFPATIGNYRGKIPYFLKDEVVDAAGSIGTWQPFLKEKHD